MQNVYLWIIEENTLKISKINFIDPYEMKKTEFDYGMDLLPKIVYPDIVNYLLFAPSPYTAEQIKCFNAMDSYNYFLSGFVKEVGAKVFINICLLVGRVSHSQTLSEKPPTAWVIAEIGGTVLSAHCNCMTGLGKPAHILVLSCFTVGLQLRKKIQLLLLGRKHIGFFLQTAKSVIKKSLTLISVAQIP